MTTARVADVAEQIRGVTFAKGDSIDERRSGYLPVLTASNITEDGLKLDSVLYIPEQKVGSRQRLQRNDVVITASSGSLSVVGRAALFDGSIQAGFGAFCKVLRPGPRVDPNFFAHFFRTAEYRAEVSRLAAGANINNLRNEDLDGFRIPLPSLPEQRRIATILDQADALRAKRRLTLARLLEARGALFEEMFGIGAHPVRTLSDVATFFAGNSLPDGLPFADQADGYLLLKVSDMNRDGNERVIVRASSWSLAHGSRASTAPAGSVVLPKRGGAIGTNKKRLISRAAILDPNLMAVSPNPNFMTSQYLFAWCERLDLRSLVTGSSVPQINKQDLAPLAIEVPPLDLQGEFEARLAIMDDLESKMRGHLTKLDELFASLQYRAFAGEL